MYEPEKGKYQSSGKEDWTGWSEVDSISSERDKADYFPRLESRQVTDAKEGV